jgi:hypothetical protein
MKEDFTIQDLCAKGAMISEHLMGIYLAEDPCMQQQNERGDDEYGKYRILYHGG